MTPERWKQIENVYHAALELTHNHRSAYLDQACADDEELRYEVESLLASQDKAKSFIETYPDDVVAGMIIAEERVRSMIGRTLGRYQLLSLIGTGGMGEVYRASDTRLDREVAVKILPEHLAADHEALHRFQREAKALAALSHPNILSIFDFGTEAGVSYAVMELLEGETLRSHLARGPLAWRKVVEIGIAITDGLDTAHAKGIIHRDLKPENIFVTHSGVVKILDFGTARMKRAVSPGSPSTTYTTKQGTVMGTIGYMSPEQVEGEVAEAPSDIFALGCIFYEMVTGRQPFARDNTIKTLAAILKEDPPALTKGDQAIPPQVERVIRRCLEKEPRARYQSAHELATDLVPR
jgi:eukaryotic-like serine/threonine-protein kinase